MYLIIISIEKVKILYIFYLHLNNLALYRFFNILSFNNTDRTHERVSKKIKSNKYVG